MTDCVLIQNGIAWEIWPGQTKVQLRPFPPDLLAAVVEVEGGTVVLGALYQDGAFTAPATPPRVVSYSDFRAQWTDAEKQALHTACTTSWQIQDFVNLALAQNTVNLTGTVGAAAKAALIAANVLAADRADQLFR